MKPKLRSYFLLMAQVAVCVLLLVLIQQLKVSSARKTCIIFTVLLLLNLFYVALFDLKETFYSYWSLRKWMHLPAGMVAGMLLTTIPIAAAVATGNLTLNKVEVNRLSLASAGLTFLITGWEELGFRSLMLNNCSRHISKFNIAVTMGLLFMMIHMLNPVITLMKEGPVLFLAGTLLTALYFYYKSIWIPAGLHFGNNFFGNFFHTTIKEHPIFGSEGYIYTVLLLVATVIFLVKLKKRAS